MTGENGDQQDADGQSRKGGLGCGGCCLGLFGLFALLLTWLIIVPMLGDDSEAEAALERAYQACSGDRYETLQADDGAVNTYDILAAECVADQLGAPSSSWDEIRQAAPRGDIGSIKWDDHAANVVSDERFHVVFIVD